MKNKKTIILIAAIILGILIGIILFFTISKVKIKKENSDIEKAARNYFSETLDSEVFIETLIENGYLKSSNKKCILVKEVEGKITSEKSNCEKAEEEASKPVVILTTSNDFKVNEWNKEGTTINLSFKNGGNSHYKESDITSVKWLLESVGGFIEGNTLNVDDVNQNSTFKLQIELKDQELVIEKVINIKVDNEVPVLKAKMIGWNSLIASYNDFSKVTGYYKVTEENKEPSKKEMEHSLNLNYECGKTYYGWAYAKDEAGNETDIEYIGEYEAKCISVSGSVDSSLKEE